jgi:hypothetical protein
MNSKPFRMPCPVLLKQLDDALWEYYRRCFPQLDEGDLYDLTQGPMAVVEDTVRRLYKQKADNERREE